MTWQPFWNSHHHFVIQAATKWHTFSLWVMPVRGRAEKAGWGTFANLNFISSLSFPFTPRVSYAHSDLHFIHHSFITLIQKPRCWGLGILIVLALLFGSIDWSWRYQVHSSKNYSKETSTHTHWYTWGEWSWMIFRRLLTSSTWERQMFVKKIWIFSPQLLKNFNLKAWWGESSVVPK